MAIDKTVVEAEIRKYAVDGWNSTSELLVNVERTAYTVLTIAQVKGQQNVDTDLIVRLIDNKVVIDKDINSKPLVEALVQGGIPRDAIVLAYAGEHLPEPESP